MSLSSDLPNETDELRVTAETRVPKPPADVSQLTRDQIARLVYELEVHQEELKIQNEELRKTQLELRKSIDQFEDLYNFAPVGYLTIDPAGTIVKSNLRAATILGRDRSNIVGSRLALFCQVEFRAILNEHLDLVCSTEAPQSCEVEFSKSDGSTLFARLESNYDELGTRETSQVRVVLSDITIRKQAERELADKDQYLRSIVDSAPMLISYIDKDHLVQFCNAAFQSWFENIPEALIGRSFPEIVDSQTAPEIIDYLNDVFSGHRVDFDMKVSHPAKGQRHLQMMLVPENNHLGGVKGCHCLALDITDRKAIEDQNGRRRILEEQLTRLSANEREVFELLIRGKSNKEIAFAIDIGLRTAERRRKIVFEKLQVESLADLLQQLADIQGIIDAVDLPS